MGLPQEESGEISTRNCCVRLRKLDVTSLRCFDCHVRVKRLNIVQYHQRILWIKRSEVRISYAPIRLFKQQERARMMKEMLEKLVHERELRDQLRKQQYKSKSINTRSSLMFNEAKDIESPETPQECFLQNFNLMPRWARAASIEPKRSNCSEHAGDSDAVTSAGDAEMCSESSSSEPPPDDIMKQYPEFHISNKSPSLELERADSSQSSREDSEKTITETRLEKRKFEGFVNEEDVEEEDLIPLRFKIKLMNEKRELPGPENNSRTMRVNLKKLSDKKYQRHVSPQKTVHQELEQCPECPRSFVKIGHLKKHINRVHKLIIDSEDVVSDDEELNLSSSAEFQCVSCNIPLSTESSLKKHEAFFHNKIINLVSRDTRECGECSKQFQCQASLKRHINTQHRGLKSKSVVCGELVARLDNHMASVHINISSPCPRCSAPLAPGHLSRYIKTVHLGYRHRQCSLRHIHLQRSQNKSYQRVNDTDHHHCSCQDYQGPNSSVVMNTSFSTICIKKHNIEYI